MYTLAPTVKFPVAVSSEPNEMFLPITAVFCIKAVFDTVNAVPSAVISNEPVSETVKVPSVLLKFPVSI